MCVCVRARVRYWSCLFWQGIMLKEYPSKLIFTTLQCLFSTFQSVFVALVFERDSSKWTLHLDLGLLAILYCVRLLSASISWFHSKKPFPRPCTNCLMIFHSEVLLYIYLFVKNSLQLNQIYFLLKKRWITGLCMTGLCHNRTYHLFTKLLYREEGPCFYSNVHAFGSCFYADMFHCFLRRNDLSRKVTYSEPTPFDLFFFISK